ncbi:MAG: hypothetical protein JSW26_17305 [Desulfobacterales bacterium]|nr:MAG: hypothetical protein JSW26_17305 [Desulfobacterales bacterium]
MIWHPLLIAVLVGDLLSLLLLLAAAKTAFKITIQWAPQSATSQQIQLERAAETSVLTAKFALGIFFASTLVLIVGITNVLPALIPGAMCGTGVLQATDGLGGRALVFRLLLLGIIYIWLNIEKLNILQPHRPLTQRNARILLLVLPFHLLAASTTMQAVYRMDTHQPVDCCAVVYDQVRNLASAQQAAGIPDTLWLLIFWTLTIPLVFGGLRAWRAEPSAQVKATGWMALLALLWVPAAAVVLIRVFAAYYYQVLHHHCPWCLFLSDHKFVGIPLFFTLAVVVLEGPTSFLTAKIAATYPEFIQTANMRARIAGLRLLLAAIAFTGMVALPAVIWRLRYGVWLQ